MDNSSEKNVFSVKLMLLSDARQTLVTRKININITDSDVT